MIPLSESLTVTSTVEPEQIILDAGVTIKSSKGLTHKTVIPAEGFPSQLAPVVAFAVTTPSAYK